jgi:hypothetical protein
MAATIISLPTSASAPVQNPRHRGRYPSTVVPGWRVSRQRHERACRATDAGEQVEATKSAEYRKGMEMGYESVRMERLAMDTLRNLATVMAYLTRANEDDK